MITAIIYACKHHRCIISFTSHNNFIGVRLESFYSKKKKGKTVYSVFCSWFEKITGSSLFKTRIRCLISTFDLSNSFPIASKRLGNATLGLQLTPTDVSLPLLFRHTDFLFPVNG